MHLHFFASYVEPSTKAARLFLRHTDYAEPRQVPSDAALGAFCFPLGKAEPAMTVMGTETYTFAITGDGGARLHGFCWRFLQRGGATGTQKTGPPGPSYPLVLCVVATNPWLQLYFRVLEVLEQVLQRDGLLSERSLAALPPGCDAATFLTAVHLGLLDGPPPGTVVRLSLPRGEYALTTSYRIEVDEKAGEGAPVDDVLRWGSDCVEVQVPPLCVEGAGSDMATVPLAFLLFELTPAIVVSLLAALLMERRVIFVSSSRQSLTYAVHAAVALIHPFRWHHIFVPILPHALLDYLTAPQPFIVGLPASLKAHMDLRAMEDVVMIDLDLNALEASGSGNDDGDGLPWRERLVAALRAMYTTLCSPMQHDANATISGIVQEYLVTLVGRYRQFARAEGQPPPPIRTSHGTTAAIRRMRQQLKDMARKRGGGGGGGGGSNPSSPPHSPTATDADMGVIVCARGWRFYHAAFAASFGSAAARDFAAALRHSQMWEVFIQERVDLLARQERGAAQAGDAALDVFEARIEKRRFLRLAPPLKSLSTQLSKVRPPSRGAVSQWMAATTIKGTSLSEATAKMRSALNRWSAPRDAVGGAADPPAPPPGASSSPGAAPRRGRGAGSSLPDIAHPEMLFVDDDEDVPDEDAAYEVAPSPASFPAARHPRGQQLYSQLAHTASQDLSDASNSLRPSQSRQSNSIVAERSAAAAPAGAPEAPAGEDGVGGRHASASAPDLLSFDNPRTPCLHETGGAALTDPSTRGGPTPAEALPAAASAVEGSAWARADDPFGALAVGVDPFEALSAFGAASQPTSGGGLGSVPAPGLAVGGAVDAFDPFASLATSPRRGGATPDASSTAAKPAAEFDLLA